MVTNNSRLDELIKAIASQSDYDFSLYSEKSLYRRVEKALDEFKLSFDELINRLNNDKEFVETFVKFITVNTTSFYRDKETWTLYEEYLHRDFKNRKEINIWHIGCSIGFEVYSNLILLDNCGILDNANIYATDINSDVLDIAQKGVYQYINVPEFKANYNDAISPMSNSKHLEIDNYFYINEKDNYIRVKKKLLDKIIFQKHDILKETNPFGFKFDIIFARNILIYLKHDAQERLYNFFYNNLKVGGYFIIGRYETIISDIYKKFKKQDVIYRKMRD